MAARLHDAALMEGERAKRALTEAPAVARKAELHLGDRGNTAVLLVHRMVRARIRQAVHRIELLLGKRARGRVLHYKLVIGIRLDEALARKRIAVAVLNGEASCIGELVGLHLKKRWQHFGIVDARKRRGAIHRAVDIGDILDGKAACKRVGYLDDGMLPHAV